MTSLLPEDLERMTPLAFSGDLQDLGWKGDFKYDDEEVVALREQLIASAGIPELEVVDPSVPGFAARAAQLLERDGVSSCS